MNTADEKNQTSFALRALVGLAAAGVVLYLLHLMSSLVNSLFLAYIIAIVASPLLIWLRKKNVPDWLAFLLTLAAVIGAFLLVVLFILNAMGEFATSLPGYIDALEQLQESLNEIIANMGLIERNLAVLLELIEVRSILETTIATISSVLGSLSDIFLVILFVVFMLVQVFTTPLVIRRELAEGNVFMQRLIKYNLDLRQYILITTAIALVTGTIDTVWFIILGIPNPVLWGIVAAILSFVPTIGFWLAAIPPTILALILYGPTTAVITFLGIVLINGFADNVIKPRYIGSGVDLSPFMVIFSVVLWATILGPLGAILGVPIMMLFKSLLFEPDGRLSWVARVMGSGKTVTEVVKSAPEDAGQTPAE